MGMLVDKDDLGFGKRSWRYSMLVRDGVIEKMFIEPEVPGDPYGVSDADTMLAHLGGTAPPDILVFTKPGCSHCARTERMLEEERSRLAKMEDALHERIIDQEEGVRAIAEAVRHSRAGLSDPRRPVGTFLFLGPTGVGKTELAKALAGFLFGSDSALLRIDMSEYMERHAVARLIGSPPGYVGYEEGGQLTEAVRRRPYQVILFDEIEKAHPQVMNLLLQLLDEGRLTDGHGRTVDFRHTILIMTSNVGSEEFQSGASEEEIQKRIREQLKKTFRPEFLNRIDEIIIFHPLSEEAIEKIVELKISGLNERLAEQGITLTLTDEAKRILAKEGYDPHYGARPLARALKRLVENPLARKIVSGEIVEGDEVVVDAAAMSDALVIRKKDGKAD
jgi:ATP-dependent Clp protease ATP-binding subunit ClpA